MNQAINAYDTITASAEFSEVEKLRTKARHDEAQALYHAKQEGRREGWQDGLQEGRQKGRQEEKLEMARNLKAIGLPFDQIAQVSGLTHSEIQNL